MVIGGGWREEGIRSRRRRRQMQGINDEVAGRSQRRSGGAVALGAVRGGGGNGGVTMSTQKERGLHTLVGLLDMLVGGTIQATSRYRSEIGPMEGMATLTSELTLLSELEHMKMIFGFYREGRGRRGLVDGCWICQARVCRLCLGF